MISSEDDTYNPPDTSTNVFTDNPPFSEIDAVNEPVAISACGGISSDSADSGISNKSLPLPLKEPLNSYAVTEPLTSTSPLTRTKLTKSTTSDCDINKEPVNLTSPIIVTPVVDVGNSNVSTTLIVPLILPWN